MLEPWVARGVFIAPRINGLARLLLAEAYERMGMADSAVATYERIATWSRCSPGEARRHWEAFRRMFTQPDPEVAHLLDDARTALEAGRRKR